METYNKTEQMGSKFPQIGMKLYHMLQVRSTPKGTGQRGGGWLVMCESWSYSSHPQCYRAIGQHSLELELDSMIEKTKNTKKKLINIVVML